MTGLTNEISLLVQGASSPFVIFIGIIAASFILEDAAAVISALAVADGHVSMWLALFSLFVGISMGDLGLYWLGRLAATHPWARRWVKTERAEKMQTWLQRRLISAVISVRFVPGARLPTYTACGFLGMPFLRFALAVIVATLIWTSILFTIALGAGRVIMSQFGVWRWPISIALVLAVILIGQYFARREARKAMGEDAK